MNTIIINPADVVHDGDTPDVHCDITFTWQGNGTEMLRRLSDDEASTLRAAHEAGRLSIVCKPMLVVHEEDGREWYVDTDDLIDQEAYVDDLDIEA